MQSDLFQWQEWPLLSAGLDEAGRGPLAGPVFAAAVILDPDQPIAGLADSKKLTAIKRDALALEIKQKARAWAIASASVAEIDQINILHAAMLAMQRACSQLDIVPELALVDGNRLPVGLPCEAQALVKGDALVPAISAASILAKTARDAYCLELHLQHPQYGFDKHKGYPTAVHMQLLQAHGPCAEHRRSFAPVKQALREHECD